MIKNLTMTECELCGKSFMRKSPSQKFCSKDCSEEVKRRKLQDQCGRRNRRFSGRIYRNDEKRMNEIKEKYKNGITADILREFAEKLQIGGK